MIELSTVFSSIDIDNDHTVYCMILISRCNGIVKHVGPFMSNHVARGELMHFYRMEMFKC